MDYLTNNQDLNEALVARAAGLPVQLQNILKSDVIEIFAHTLKEQFNLTEEEEEDVTHEIMLVVFTIESVDSLLVNFISEALIPPEKAEKMVAETKKSFFAPFIQFLKQNEPVDIPTEPVLKPTEVNTVEKPYIEEPVKKASYGAILDVPHYGVETTADIPKPTETVIPQTPAIRVQPTFETPTSAPRAPQRILTDAHNVPPPQAQ